MTTSCPELAEDKKRELPFEQVDTAAFSFKNLAKISNLWGLDKLVKLQLDNNRIEKIENLRHLVSILARPGLHCVGMNMMCSCRASKLHPYCPAIAVVLPTTDFAVTVAA